MQSIIIFMNCIGDEIFSYFNNIPEIKNNYDIRLFLTYSNLDDGEILQNFTKCDILILNDIKKYKNHTIENIKKILTPECKIVKVEFIRFNGFHIFPHDSKKFLYVYDESVLNTDNYVDYINYNVNKDRIIDNFNTELVKLEELDKNSDIKFYNFFMNNYKSHLLFRDNTHLSAYFIKHIVKEILNYLHINICDNFIDDLSLPYSYGHMFRYKIILHKVKKDLELNFDDSEINFYNKIIIKEHFYNNIKILINENDTKK